MSPMRSWYLPLMRCRTNASAAATVVKNVASFGALELRCAAGKRAIMLDEASIIRAMRRPGKLTCSCVRDEYGSASASTKNGRPARTSSSAPWRTMEIHDPPLQSRTAGSATCVRPAQRRVVHGRLAAVLCDGERAQGLLERFEKRGAPRA